MYPRYVEEGWFFPIAFEGKHELREERRTPASRSAPRRGAHLALLLLSGLLPASAYAAGAAALESREVSFQSAGYRLTGTLSSPARGTALAGFLIIPGSGPVDRNGNSKTAPAMPPVYRQWAGRLGEGGLAVLRYDKRFIVHPNLDVPSFDQEAQIADAVSALRFLQSALVSKLVFILGHSEGGTLAPLVAERTRGVAGVVIVNTVHFPVDELLVEQLQASPDFPRGMLDEVKRLLPRVKDGSFPKGGLLLGAGGNYWAQWIDYSAKSPETLSRLPISVLLVQCLNDETLPGETLARNVAALHAVVSKNKNARLRELEGRDHLCLRPGERESRELPRIVLEWLRNDVRAAQP